ncbi:PqqD family peptide modification chaperone [Rhizorhabdus sp.]
MPEEAETAALHSVLSRNPDFMWSEVDGEIVMLDVANGSYISFDHVASEIWRLIETPLDVGALVDRLCLKYDADRSIIESDAMRFLDRAIARDVIRVEG